jgi:hypothetical protein
MTQTSLLMAALNVVHPIPMLISWWQFPEGQILLEISLSARMEQ